MLLNHYFAKQFLGKEIAGPAHKTYEIGNKVDERLFDHISRYIYEYLWINTKMKNFNISVAPKRALRDKI